MIFSCHLSFAQETETKDTTLIKEKSFKDRFFKNTGAALFTDIDILPLRDVTFSKHVSSGNYGGYVNFQGKYTGFSIAYFTYIYQLRYNVYEANEDFSLSVNAPLALGFSMFFSSNKSLADPVNPPVKNIGSENFGSGIGFFKLSVPLFFQLNYGNLATQTTAKDHGVTLGIGVDYQINPIFLLNMDDVSSNLSINRSNFIIPSMNIGYRLMTEKDIPMEINLKVGMGTSSTFTSMDGHTISQNPMSILLSWHTYIDYY